MDHNNEQSTLDSSEDSIIGGILSKFMDGMKYVNNTVQDIDGGFFENFGVSLVEKSKELSDTALLYTIGFGRKFSHGEALIRSAQEDNNDDGIASQHDEIISQLENPTLKQDNSIKEYSGLNSEELYKEILFELSNNIGSEDGDQQLLFKYVQGVFKVNNERHEELLQASSRKKLSEMRLNVEVLEAKELAFKDVNGLSDPFVTMYFDSAPLRHFNTSVQSRTLNPEWNEHFSLPLPDRMDGLETEVLVIEVWDFDPAETITKKLSSILDVKNIRGFRRFLKEITAIAMNEPNLNELIGRCEISLATIPAAGQEMWCKLKKLRKKGDQGTILLRLSFSAAKNKEVATQEHTHLLRILLLHELEHSNAATYRWCGKFSEPAVAIINQHCAQSGITQNLIHLAQWSAYTTVHLNNPLPFHVFDSLLEKMQHLLHEPTTEPITECSKLFWEGAKKLLPSCFSVIRNIDKKMSSDMDPLLMLNEVLLILSKLIALRPPNDFDLFPKKMHGWINRISGKTLDIHSVIDEAILSGAQDFLCYISEINRMGDNDEQNLRNLVNITQLVRKDLQRGVKIYDKLFEQKLQCKYTPIRFNYYSQQLTKIIQETVENTCTQLQNVTLPKHGEKPTSKNGEVNMGSSLFELYLIFKELASRRSVLAPDSTNWKAEDFHKWFTNGVAHWLDIAAYKALNRIEKAIEIDRLVPVEDNRKYSSSAVDTLSIFYTIEKSWQELDWPDIEESYTFLMKIIDDIGHCCVFYADTMKSRIESLQKSRNIDDKKFEVTSELCLAINNIEHIKQSLPTFVKKLKMNDIIEKLPKTRNTTCDRTFKQLVSSYEETLKGKLASLIESVVHDMCMTMEASLQNAAEKLHQNSKLLRHLMSYIDNSSMKLHEELTRTNFRCTQAALWPKLAATANDIVKANERSSSQLFSNLRESLNAIIQIVEKHKMENYDGRKAFEGVENLLRLYSCETYDLIHEYFLSRYYQQQNAENSPHGQLTVRCGFTDENSLEVEILNARNLVSTSSSCDPFVQIYLSPANKFDETIKYKTNTQYDTKFPLFDEKIVIPMSHEQRSLENNLVILRIKDLDYLGMAKTFLSECFITFGEIEQSDRLQQKHLALSRPTKTIDCDVIRVLEQREDDKEARKFFKKTF